MLEFDGSGSTNGRRCQCLTGTEGKEEAHVIARWVSASCIKSPGTDFESRWRWRKNLGVIAHCFDVGGSLSENDRRSWSISGSKEWGGCVSWKGLVPPRCLYVAATRLTVWRIVRDSSARGRRRSRIAFPAVSQVANRRCWMNVLPTSCRALGGHSVQCRVVRVDPFLYSSCSSVSRLGRLIQGLAQFVRNVGFQCLQREL